LTGNNVFLRVKNLRTHFHRSDGTVKAVDGISFEIKEGTTLGLAGESGCGKTTVAMSMLNLIPYMIQVGRGQSTTVVSKGEIVGGEVWYKGRDLFKLSQEEMRQIRGKEIAMIFQNPIPALNPLETIGFQVGETVTAHDQARREKLRQLVFDYLGRVELKDAEKRYKNNPAMFSGGEGQRMMVAMALINAPSLLIADEPTKSLDVIVQKQVLTLINEMKKQFNLSMLLIAHDLAVIAEASDYVAIMYSGKIVEYGDVFSICKDPKHPYTQGLLDSIPRLYGKTASRGFRQGLRGEPPNPVAEVSGCRFHPRCPYTIQACKNQEPPLVEVKPNNLAACIRVNEIPAWHD
jgi:peptide/nickel transport system ATP-binding protein